MGDVGYSILNERVDRGVLEWVKIDILILIYQ